MLEGLPLPSRMKTRGFVRAKCAGGTQPLCSHSRPQSYGLDLAAGNPGRFSLCTQEDEAVDAGEQGQLVTSDI